MKLTSISIQNYRSITSVKSIPLENYCIILGKNNEGKTNVLNAINLAMVTLKSMVSDTRSYRFYKEFREYKYDYERDYPIILKDSKNFSPTKLILKFKFNDDEIKEFVSKVGVYNNGDLSIEIIYNKQNLIEINVLEKRGKGAITYKNKIREIISFLVDNIVFQYIPAVRTEDDTLNKLNELVNQELEILADDEEYKQAMLTVHNKQLELMNELNLRVSDMIKVFLPNIQETEIELIDDSRRMLRRNIDFYVNDGSKTHISYKGDGVKSLITLALLNSSKQAIGSRIIAIEEPESHLHPEAIHQINSVIQQISNTSQVIITTHNGSFVNRGNISSNIIIDNGIGRKANNIQEIRELLGIKLSDNLISSETVVIVEGSDDAISLEYIFSKLSAKVKNAINNKKIAFTDMGGATNLKYKCALYASMMCKYFVIVDADKCGISSYEEAKQKGLVEEKNSAILYAYGDNKESEFEDFLKKDFYKDLIYNDYGVDLEVKEFKGCKYKWSDRLKKSFNAQSKPFGDKTEAEIKEKIADMIVKTDSLNDILPDCYLEKLKYVCAQIERILDV